MFNVTNQAELEAFCAYAMPVFLERLKTAAMKAGNIELATTLEGVTSLPSIQSLGGVEKTVRVPLTLLTKDVNLKIGECESVIVKAGTATDNANAAAARANNAASTADSATAATVAAISKANTAADNANAAADRANAVVAGDGSVMYVTLAEYKSMWQSGAIQEKCIYVVDKHSTRALYVGTTKIYPPASGTLLSDGVFRYDNVLDMDANVLIK